MLKQSIIPVLKGIRDCEQSFKVKQEYVIIMDVHISQLEYCCKLVKKHDKKLIIHLDLIKGLDSNEYAVEYLVHNLQAEGIISVKRSIIKKVKKLKKIAIQRIFIIDSHSYMKSIELINSTCPDYIELLPGCLFKMITRLSQDVNVKVIAGGLIETKDEYIKALKSGATAITTSKKELIKEISDL